jgi:Bacterial toxin 23
MKKKYCYIFSFYFLATGYCLPAAAQSRRVYSNNELSFQYGFSLKGLLEFSLNKLYNKPVFRLCTNFGLGSNLLTRALYFSINGELQLYNGGLGSKRREANKKPAFTLDLINAFTLTTGINNYFSSDSIHVVVNRKVPLYYFSNFSDPALQNPYDYSISVGTNFIISSDKYRSDQRVGFLNLHLKKIQVSYYNDGGTPFEETFLGDGKDRFYTGGALICYHGNSNKDLNLIELSFQKFTGYSKDAFEVSNKLDLAFVNYNKSEEKYYNKSLWSLNISNPEKGLGIKINRYNYTDWDIQHLIHFSIFNSYHLVPYDDYFSVSCIYYHNYTNIGLR